MIKLFDDALPKEDQDYLEDILLGVYFPYFFRDNTTYEYQQDTCQFQHNFCYFGKENSKYFEEFYGKFKSFIEIGVHLSFCAQMSTIATQQVHSGVHAMHKL